MAVQERRVGFVFQHYAAFKHMTVRDNVAFGLKIRKKGKSEIRGARARVAGLVHLEGLHRPLPRSSRADSASARRSRERSPGWSPRSCCSTSRSARSTRSARGFAPGYGAPLHDEVHVTTIFVTHDQEEAMDVAEQIVVMNDGAVSRQEAHATCTSTRTRSS